MRPKTRERTGKLGTVESNAELFAAGREQARRFSPDQLAALHAAIVATDRALKGGFPAEVLLTSLVSAMAGREEAILDLPVRVTR